MDNTKWLLAAGAGLALLLLRPPKLQAPGAVLPAGVIGHEEVPTLPAEKTGPDAIRRAIGQVRDQYGPDMARAVERIYRLETAHFASLGFRKTYAAGMEAPKGKEGAYPYGWTTLAATLWKDAPAARPIGVLGMREGDGITTPSRGIRPFLIFPTLSAAMMSLAETIAQRGRPGAWFSRLKGEQEKYEEKLRTIKARYV